VRFPSDRGIMDTIMRTASPIYRILRSFLFSGIAIGALLLPASTLAAGQITLSLANVTATTVSISWTTWAGTDHYDIMRAGVKIGAATGLSYQDTGLQKSTAYQYQIIARDATGLATLETSNTLSATTVASNPPTAPTNLKALVSGGTAILTWSAGTGDGTLSYLVFLNGTQVNTPVTNGTYQSPVLDPGTYTYTVKTEDGNAQISPASNAAVVIIQAPSPTPAATPTPTATPQATPSPTAAPTPKYSPTPDLGTPEPTLPPVALSLDKIQVADQLFTPNPSNLLKLPQGKTITLTGSAPADAALVLSLYSDPQTFTLTADSKGQWKYDLPTSSLALGSHRLTISTKGLDGTSSAEQEILQFTLVDANQTPSSTSVIQSASADRLKQVALAFIILAALGVVISGGVMIRQSRATKKMKTAEEAPLEAPAEPSPTPEP